MINACVVQLCCHVCPRGSAEVSSWRPPGQEVGGGLVAAHPVAPPELPLVGQSQKDSWMGERGEGRVEVLLQLLLQQALIRKMFLKEKGQEPRDISAGYTG